ncbi:LysR family transcriptional regulator [Rosenbergiella epipactidis]|uniref:LysR family transcriptional regulator n=1 Tax=Rosenbergiella epipactidis TaxID=1544694 RepID=UPI001F4E1CBF|nr:LysR family transcriptional regulator [Rosenbergiella epipactidis]
MKFYLKDFWIFISIAETKSLSKTASQMGMSVSSISKRLTRLESYLQITLFERTTRSIKLSPMGEIAYEKSLLITEEFQRFIDELKSSKSTLKISTPHRFIESFLIDWCYEYCKNKRSIDISVIESKENMDSLDIDELFITNRKSGYPLAIHRQLHPVKRVICCRADMENVTDIKVPGDLRKLPTIYFIANEGEHDIELVKKGDSYTFANDGLHLSSIEESLKMVLDKGCVLVGIPLIHVRQLVKMNKIKVILSEWEMKELNYYLVWKDRPYFKNELAEFLKYIEYKWKEECGVY